MMSSQSKKPESRNNHYAILSGVCASSASFFGKLMGNISEPNSSQGNYLNNIWILRLICIFFMISCNVFVWTFFVKALHSTGGTVIATVTSAASNYILSFIIGAIIFNEKISFYSIAGLSLILLGLFFISRNNVNQSNKEK